jgi:RHS repeat-associated protein
LDSSTTYYFAIKTADDVSNWSGISNSSDETTTAGGSGYDTEEFEYDDLDRLKTVSEAYNESYEYDTIGNMVTHNQVSYTYPTNGIRPHAVSSVGATNYAYDANGNMTTRGNQTIAWDVENRITSVTGGASFIYDGDSTRVKKTENGETILYVNKYYEKNLTTGVVTTYYYLGGKLVAQRAGTTLEYMHQDSLSSTSVVSDHNGALVSSINYFPFGECLQSQGDLGTDKLFTGQRLDDTGLYYYGARYYDPTIGRFVSPDSIVQSMANPQTLNRYSYCLNNPLKYTDPTGHLTQEEYILGMTEYGVAPSTNPMDNTNNITFTQPSLPVSSSTNKQPNLPSPGEVFAASAGTLVVVGPSSAGTGYIVFGILAGGYCIVYCGVKTGFFSSAWEWIEDHPTMIDVIKDQLSEGDDTIQTGGHTVSDRTARQLNEYLGENKTAGEWGDDLESLKDFHEIPSDYHGTKIKRNGDVYDRHTGEKIGNLQDY